MIDKKRIRKLRCVCPLLRRVHTYTVPLVYYQFNKEGINKEGMRCAHAAYAHNHESVTVNSFQLEAALAASLQREQALVHMVEQQRCEIDRLRATINALQLSDALRSLDFATPPPSITTSPQQTPAHRCTPGEVLNASFDQLRMY
jgi:hypothetical protein